MPLSQLMTVHDISALSDAQLGEFMKKHRRADDSFELPIDGWERLSKEERDCLAQRLQFVHSFDLFESDFIRSTLLRSIQRVLSGSPSVISRPLDLDKLDTLLHKVANGRDSLSPEHSPARSSERVTQSPEDPQVVYKQKELEAYHNLVNDGGRALYRVDLLESVLKDPDEYLEMLLPFWRGPRCNNLSEMDGFSIRAVTQRQWHRWQNFRKWQLNHRGIDSQDKDDDFPAYLERIIRNYNKVGWAEHAAEIEADPTIINRPGTYWYGFQRHRKWQRLHQREPGCSTFSDYEDAVKARLARHGFTRQFHLAEDPKRQDSLTTWIEYLGFEYWWLDRYTASTKRLKPEHDEAWEELKRQGVVKDDETPEFVRTHASGTRCDKEEDDARQAVQDAESEAKNVYQKTQKGPGRLRIPKERRVRMLVKATQKLLAARKALDEVKRRSNLLIAFVRGTFDYDGAKEDEANQTNLVEWVLAEAYAIEAE
ncbi:hypothetical protein NOR_02743 [Metarhizium rileyi]|uniref:Uncharacterized protein n=1 Tax=Metarhizium rileyi (strain RCEF 4871) TaxID=1649241 RepID=A0A167GUC3_METRR|nr:hypothetical protein NOR_02743 [Metarhizium rileyi RCEF 4871]